MLGLAAGVLAGLAAWLAAEPAHHAFQPRRFPVTQMGLTSLQPTPESQHAADLKNATLVYAILGGLTGLAMGAAGGLIVRSPGHGLVVGVAGLAAGSLAVAAVGSVLLPYFFRGPVPDINDLLTPILLHGGIWMVIGAVGGSAFALGMKRRRHLFNAMAAACVGGFLASILFHLLGGSLFTGSEITDAVAKSTAPRLLAMIFVTVLVAVGAANGALSRVHDRRSVPAS
jgi:hypothetical protein